MNNFGKIKSKVLAKLVESYSTENKKEIKSILKTIKENNDFKEMYLFYEEIENKYFEDNETAKLYVEEINKILSNKSKSLTKFCKNLNEKLGDININENEVYELVDQLSEEDSLRNIDKKVLAKKKLVEHLTTKKQTTTSTSKQFVQNESLLHAVLANNFNVLYDNSLTEDQKNELKNILSLSSEKLEEKSNELKESLKTKITSLIEESSDSELKSKLNKVLMEVNMKDSSRLSIFQLSELQNGLN